MEKKYALVNDNIVQNIMVCENEEVIKLISSEYQYIVPIKNNDFVAINHIYKGGKFEENPSEILKREKENKLIFESFRANIIKIKETKPEELTDEQKDFLKFIEHTKSIKKEELILDQSLLLKAAEEVGI